MKSLLLAALALITPLAAQLPLVPKPVSLQAGQGAAFQLGSNTRISYGGEDSAAAELLALSLRPATGLSLTVVKSGSAGVGNIHLQLGEVANAKGREAYQLVTRKEGVTLTARTPAGLINAGQTLRQLLDTGIYHPAKHNTASWQIPPVTITDEPSYPWRGMMLDVSRYFFTKQYVLRYLDMMAMHKMNVLHWHLIDDCGWRIEIKKYPKLTEVGAWRGQGNERTGGFYTQNDIREIVAYAKARNVEVVPEIEIPAHTLAALAAYPELGCLGKQFEVPTHHSISPEIYCVGKESTWEFLEGVMGEICGMFPFKFIHIGGDEARYQRWNDCEHCQKRMKKEGLKSAKELQGWATTRIENALKKHDKLIIGWDEILDCGVSKQAGIMTWNNLSTAVEGAKRGNPIVMSLTGHAYFDVAESKLPGEPPAASWIPPISLEKAYNWEPTPKGLDAPAAKNILGANGCVWSDQFLHSPSVLADKPGRGTAASEGYVDYLSLPRMAALAEVTWTPLASRDYQDFSQRMKVHYLRYQQAGYKFRMPTPMITAKRLADGGLSISGECPIAGGSVRYTLDGTEPGPASKELTAPLEAPKDATFKAATYAANGSHSLTWTFSDEVNKFAQIGKKIGEWKSSQISKGSSKTVSFDATGFIDGNGSYVITFQFTNGLQRLDIDGIEVVRNGSDPVGKDIHHGFTGGSQQANAYTIKVDNYQTGASFTVKAMIYGDTGDDSNGVVLIRKQ
jgi:hexosaminidase